MLLLVYASVRVLTDTINFCVHSLVVFVVLLKFVSVVYYLKGRLLSVSSLDNFYFSIARELKVMAMS